MQDDNIFPEICISLQGTMVFISWRHHYFFVLIVIFLILRKLSSYISSYAIVIKLMTYITLNSLHVSQIFIILNILWLTSLSEKMVFHKLGVFGSLGWYHERSSFTILWWHHERSCFTTTFLYDRQVRSLTLKWFIPHFSAFG